MTIDAAFTSFPTITTKRLHLRQLRPTDAEALFALKSDPRVTEPYGREPQQSLDDTYALMQQLQGLYEGRSAFFWVITLRGEERVIGSCTLFQFDLDSLCAETGYELYPDYWHRGIVAEAMSSLLAYGFTELGLHRIEANVGANNTPSQNVVRKLGFTFEGNLRQRYFFRGTFEDQYCFGLLKDEWLARVL